MERQAERKFEWMRNRQIESKRKAKDKRRDEAEAERFRHLPACLFESQQPDLQQRSWTGCALTGF